MEINPETIEPRKCIACKGEKVLPDGQKEVPCPWCRGTGEGGIPHLSYLALSLIPGMHNFCLLP